MRRRLSVQSPVLERPRSNARVLLEDRHKMTDKAGPSRISKSRSGVAELIEDLSNADMEGHLQESLLTDTRRMNWGSPGRVVE
jgi:hypothetical protein